MDTTGDKAWVWAGGPDRHGWGLHGTMPAARPTCQALRATCCELRFLMKAESWSRGIGRAGGHQKACRTEVLALDGREVVMRAWGQLRGSRAQQGQAAGSASLFGTGHLISARAFGELPAGARLSAGVVQGPVGPIAAAQGAACVTSAQSVDPGPAWLTTNPKEGDEGSATESARASCPSSVVPHLGLWGNPRVPGWAEVWPPPAHPAQLRLQPPSGHWCPG